MSAHQDGPRLTQILLKLCGIGAKMKLEMPENFSFKV